MIPVLAVFIDALSPEDIKYMEFLNSFENKVRVKTELPSYSNTCHASIYTGVFPEKHQSIFTWRYSPESSPFQLLRKLKIINILVSYNRIFKLLTYLSICKLYYEQFHIPYFYFLSRYCVDYWGYFDLKMVRHWNDPDPFIGKYPTIFEILKRNGIEYQTIWLPKGSLRRIEQIRDTNKPFTYIFIGHTDGLFHHHLQDSKKAKKVLKEIDRVLKRVYFRFKTNNEDLNFLVFSDHGHIQIEKRISLNHLFKSNGKSLKDYIHFIDACQARFWFKNEKEEIEVKSILNEINDKGYVLNDKILRDFHARVNRNLYGHLILQLRPSYVFAEAVPPNTISMHGYPPDDPRIDGVLISNKEISTTCSTDYIKLEDITPTILHALELKIPSYMDGELIWR